MIRTRRAEVRPLLPDGSFFDVSDPDVSWDGTRILFSATVAPDSGWRIWVVGADGSGLAAVTRSDRAVDLSSLGMAAARLARYDDLDPCWLPDGRVCFASTRYPQVAEIGGLAVTNLFVCDLDGGNLTRITAERNGAEEPTVDPTNGRLVYARWWFNRFLPSDIAPSGITTDPAQAIPAEVVNLWQAVSAMPDGDDARIAGGNPRVRPETMAYQPAVLADGSLIGVRGETLSLSPDGGALSVEIFLGGFARARRLAGGEPPAAACAPVPLPDGRIVFSYDPHGSGDYGLYVVDRNGRVIRRVVDLEGSLELDAAPLGPRRRPPVLPRSSMIPPRDLPVAQESVLRDSVSTFRFDCLNVFANAPVDAPIPDAPVLAQGLTIRFYASLSRPAAAGGDTVVLLREAPVTASGAVHEHDLPADTPLFEQLVDAHGRVLRSSSGPTHVPGFNAGRYGSGTKCVGCHAGHSAIPVATSANQGKRFNASPSAEVWATSAAEGTAGARAAVDRRARGPAARVAWVAATAGDERIRLRWQTAIEVDTVVIYPISPRFSEGTDLRVRGCELAFFRDGRELFRSAIRGELSPDGTRVECRGLRVDEIEIRPTRFTGRVLGRPALGLAEIETRARLIED